ncbi:MAG TPA: type II secretion system protein [Candidatus Saccharimonadia bacterium]
MSNLLKREKGFTLIEIVLVLAIAGLLLVIVFLAVQGANRSRRDAQRKQDAGRMLAAMSECASNNNGQYGTTCSGTTSTLISGGYFSGSDPNGTAYSLVGGAPANPGEIRPGYGVNAACPGTTANTAYVQVYQEAGSAYCVHN